MTKLIIAILLSQILTLIQCGKTVEADKINIKGDWVLKNVFLGDVIDQPCAATGTVNDSITITLKIISAGEKVFNISGHSAVNLYNAKLKVTAFDNTDQIGTLKISAFTQSLMAGTTEAIACEDRYFSILSNSTDFKIDNGKLLIGVFKNDNSPSRDGGTYLIFEKSK